MEGGFDGGVEKVEYEEQLSVVAMPERATVSLPNEQLPQKVVDILSLSLSTLLLRQNLMYCVDFGLHSWYPGCSHGLKARSHHSLGGREETSFKVSVYMQPLIYFHHISLLHSLSFFRHAETLKQLDNGVKIPPRYMFI